MRNSETMWKFETEQFRIEWRISPCDDVDLSWDETGETAENLNSGLWTAFDSEMVVIHKPTGLEIGADYLGQSIYESPADFRDHFGMKQKGHGSYFSDMVREAVGEARKTIARLPH